MDKTNKKELTPKEYFEILKTKKEEVTDARLQDIYSNAVKMLEGFIITEQQESAKKMIYHMETIEKEHELVKLGVTTFVYKEDVVDFINNISDDVVKVIELKNYQRALPEEAIQAVSKTKHLFDEFFIVFTDYTGEAEKKVKKERIEKDPILFGVFFDKKQDIAIERFYFLADWEDEYCDLTLDKMVSVMEADGVRDPRHTIESPQTLEELKVTVNNMQTANRDGNVFSVDSDQSAAVRPEPIPFFKKIRTFFSRHK